MVTGIVEAVGATAATSQLGQQLLGIISTTRRVIKEFKAAEDNHNKLSKEFDSIGKV
jgi:hypothetical protein